MREIKFRAWDKKSKEMYTVIEMGWRNGFGVRIGYLGNSSWGSRPRMADEVELMQYTGLHDKNGKEIYEGDICISPRDEKGIVKFVNAGFWIEYVPPYDWDCMCPGEPVTRELEVIGNVFEVKNAHRPARS